MLAAEAGFTHLHWCHQWCGDFIYGKAELEAIAGWLKEFGLTLLDIHGTDGHEKKWYSTEPYQRKAGVEIVANRLEMLAELGGEGVLMMHVPFIGVKTPEWEKPWIRRQVECLKRSIDELLPLLERNQALIAVENMWGDDGTVINDLLDSYSPERIGLCYDSGHANANDLKQLDLLDARKDRLQALHLHDNDGMGDQHMPPFTATVDWDRLAQIIAGSSYNRVISFEMSMTSTPFFDKEAKQQSTAAIQAFLRDAHERCPRFARGVDAAREDIEKHFS